MNKKVELEVIDISNSQAQIGAFALILGEKEGTRQLPVIIGTAEAQATALCLKGTKTPRPLTHDLFYNSLHALGVHLLRVVIYKVEEGVFFSYIYLKINDEITRIDSRTSDAIALSLRFNSPIYIYESILEKECIRTAENEIHQENSLRNSAFESIKKTSVNDLEKALQKAIFAENYELAACLRDELKKQK